jgi:hypothetical protein
MVQTRPLMAATWARCKRRHACTRDRADQPPARVSAAPAHACSHTGREHRAALLRTVGMLLHAQRELLRALCRRDGDPNVRNAARPAASDAAAGAVVRAAGGGAIDPAAGGGVDGGVAEPASLHRPASSPSAARGGAVCGPASGFSLLGSEHCLAGAAFVTIFAAANPLSADAYKYATIGSSRSVTHATWSSLDRSASTRPARASTAFPRLSSFWTFAGVYALTHCDYQPFLDWQTWICTFLLGFAVVQFVSQAAAARPDR